MNTEIDRLVKRLQTAIEVHLGAQKAFHQYSRYEIRKLWPYTEQEISFEATTKLLRESRSGGGEEERKVDVEKLMANVRSYFLSQKKEEGRGEDFERWREYLRARRVRFARERFRCRDEN